MRWRTELNDCVNKYRKSYFLIYTEHQGHRVSPLVVSFLSSPIGLKSGVTCSNHEMLRCVDLVLFSWHRFRVFTRLTRVTCFPRLTRVTRFRALESCNFDLWFWLVPLMTWIAFTFSGGQYRISLKGNHTKSKRLLKSSNLFLNVASQLITRASSSSRLSGSWLCLTWRALCLSTVVKQEQKRNRFAWLVVSRQTGGQRFEETTGVVCFWFKNDRLK